MTGRPRPAHIRAYFHRCLCKLWELVLRLRTRLVYGRPGDVTSILVDHLTPEQLAAERAQAVAPSQVAGRSTRLLALVPFRDLWSLSTLCLDALTRQQIAGVELRIVLIDNGSVEPETAKGIVGRLAQSRPGCEFHVVRDDHPFNFSRLNNDAVKAHADFAPDYLLFLNNDVELSTPEDLQALVTFARTCPKLGALGSTLLFPNGRIQHLFVAPGVKVVAAHPLKGAVLAPNAAWLARPRAVAALTGALMLVPAAAFAAVGGFDEALPSVGQDVDICLKLRGIGLGCWVLPQVRAVHHEGASRKYVAIDKEQVRHMYRKWGLVLARDKLYSSRLSRWSEMPLLTLGEGAYPWEKVLP